MIISTGGWTDTVQYYTDRFHAYFHYTITAYGKDIEPGDTVMQGAQIQGLMIARLWKRRRATKVCLLDRSVFLILSKRTA